VSDVKFPKAKVRLVGEDGNAFAIMARVRQALHRAGASEAELKQYADEAMSGDYGHLLRVTMSWVSTT
jgi:hypothetical protein